MPDFKRVILAVLLVLGASAGSAGAGDLGLTPEEEAWLSDHRSKEIRYVMPPRYRPISFVEEGHPRGIAAEYIRFLEDTLDLKFSLVDLPFTEGLKLARQGEIDLFPCLSYTEERPGI